MLPMLVVLLAPIAAACIWLLWTGSSPWIVVAVALVGVLLLIAGFAAPIPGVPRR